MTMMSARQEEDLIQAHRSGDIRRRKSIINSMFRTVDVLDASNLPVTLLQVRAVDHWINAFNDLGLLRAHANDTSFILEARRFIARNRYGQLEDAPGSSFGEQLDILEELLPKTRKFRLNEEVVVYYWPSPESVKEALRLGLEMESFRPGWQTAYVIRRNVSFPEGANLPMMQLSWLARAGPGDVASLDESFWVHEAEIFRLHERTECGWRDERKAHKNDPGWTALDRLF